MQDLWQVRYQMLLIILQKEFTNLIVKIVIFFLEYESVKHSLLKY